MPVPDLDSFKSATILVYMLNLAHCYGESSTGLAS